MEQLCILFHLSALMRTALLGDGESLVVIDHVGALAQPCSKLLAAQLSLQVMHDDAHGEEGLD